MENLKLPYVSPENLKISGKIKQIPEHFIVEEVPLYKPSRQGNHLFVSFTKKQQTTKEIERQVCSLFNLKQTDIGIAGMKDKLSISTQTISINTENLNLNKEQIIDKLKTLNIKINSAEFHNNKLKPGHLLGNNFKIIISEIKNPEKDVETSKKIIKEIEKNGIPNFYGSQRFGLENNEQKGKLILENKLRIKDKWLRKFLISSYQSYLFNYYLAKRIEKNKFNSLLKGDIAKKHSTGGLFFVENLDYEQKRFDEKEISFTGPIFGIKMLHTKQDSLNFEQEILRENKIDLEIFSKFKIKGSRRISRILIKKINLKSSESKIELSFFLPKGSFATVVLREFLKNSNDKNNLN